MILTRILIACALCRERAATLRANAAAWTQ